MWRPGILPALLVGVSASAGDGPLVSNRTALPAAPVALSLGQAGPFNRLAFELRDGDSVRDAPQVTCLYPGGIAYRCEASTSMPRAGDGYRRITVVAPDLGLGTAVTLRFVTRGVLQDVAIVLVNASHVVHEIETLPLPARGGDSTPADGRAVPTTALARIRTTSTPAMATSAVATPPGCDRIHAVWVGASATDPVFAGPSGTLNGSVMPSRPVTPGSRVATDNLPEWIVTYPLDATRVQFIAHYEVIYRVGVCPQKVIARPATG